MADQIPPSQGRGIFGHDSALYEGARPGYPERVYELLAERCGLADGCRTIEVGPGSGQATKRLVERGARTATRAARTVSTPVSKSIATPLARHGSQLSESGSFS